MLHREGELYLLSAGYLTGLEGYGSPPPYLYVGMDSRPLPTRDDTLEKVVQFESQVEAYRRIPVDTRSGFSLIEHMDHPAIQHTLEWTIPEDGEPIGVVNQMFVCTAQRGSAGKLLQTIKFKKSREITDGMIFTGEMTYGFFNVEELQQ